jgi:ATP/maltotriose-dependent transcriptional regulator MalT
MEGVSLDGPATRVRPPHVRRDLVSRPRLLGLLESGAGRRLTVVSAPAGFGKTALLAEWASTAGRPVAWLSLDEGDRDPGFCRRTSTRLSARFAGRSRSSSTATS